MNKSASPYLDARQEWTERFGSYIKQRNVAVVIAIIALIVSLIAVLGVVYIGAQSKYIPYVVEIDRVGNAVNVRPIEQDGTVRGKDLVKTAQLSEFVFNARTVTPDIQLQKQMIIKAYSMLNGQDPAAEYLNDYYCGGECDLNPFNRAQKETVEIKVETLLQQTADTWQIEWLETVRDRKGQSVGLPIRMRGLFTVYVETPQTLDGILNNPTGLKIKELSWAKQL